jgi:hypothetical protein
MTRDKFQKLNVADFISFNIRNSQNIFIRQISKKIEVDIDLAQIIFDKDIEIHGYTICVIDIWFLCNVKLLNLNEEQIIQYKLS